MHSTKLKGCELLKKMKMKDDLLKNVITSGEAAMIAVSKIHMEKILSLRS